MKIAVPQKWNAGVGSTNSVTGQWWLQFDDPKLGALVHEALSNNFDLRVAAKRLELAQVQARMADYSSRPKFAASVNGEKRQSNYIGMPFGGNEVIKSRTESFASNLSVNWELDLWARIRHAQDAVELEVYAVNLDNEAAAHSIISQVVKGWFSLGEANQLTKLMEQQLELAQLAQKQVEIRFMLGRATASELKRAQANLAYYHSRLSQLSNSIVRYSRALELILGRHVGQKPLVAAGLPDTISNVPVGLPSGVLRRRPDIAASITRVKAARERIAEGEAGLLPSLSLTGSAGTSSNQLKDLLNGNFLAWALGSTITQNILLADERMARIREREVNAELALLEHRAVVFKALNEVEQSLEVGMHLACQQEELLVVARKYVELIDLSKERHAKGVGSLSEILEAKRLHVESSMDWVRLKKQQIDNRVNLHLALGGGFALKEANNETSSAD